MRLRLWAVAFLSTCAGGYAQEIVTAFVAHNYIGCRDPDEINRVFADYATIEKRAHGAALELRRCVFLSQGDLVSIVGDAPPATIEGKLLEGYFVKKPSGRAVWFPRQLLNNFSSRPAPKSPPEPTADPDLSGPLPVGRWSVWRLFDPDRYYRENYHEYEIELSTDGSGYILLFHGEDGRPKKGFASQQWGHMYGHEGKNCPGSGRVAAPHGLTCRGCR